MNKINSIEMDRITAIVIYDNKVFEDSNHQFALQEALSSDDKNKLSLDENLKDFDYVDKFIDNVSNLTFNLDKEAKIACLDIFEGDSDNYIVAHSMESFKEYRSVIEDYAKENSLKVGYFEDLNDDEFVLI